jgi:TatD DNase family protein
MESGPSSPAQLELVDSHAHLDMSEFDSDRTDMLARAQAAGVRQILAIGGAPGALASAWPFAEQYDWIYAAAGIHPHEAKLAKRAHYDELLLLAKRPKFLAWGEIGLDYHYDHSPREVQQRVFIEQLELARVAAKPVIIHCREAWPDCLALLQKHWGSSGLGGIFHCFSGTLDEARRGREMGFLISFAGNVTYPKAQNLREAAAALPLESILIETDSPFLAPQPFRGRRNEPAFVAEVARTLAPVRNLAPHEVGAATAANFRDFFGLSATDGRRLLTRS